MDRILIGLHEPRASHLDPLVAVGGRRLAAEAYFRGPDNDSLWHELGDTMLLLGKSPYAS